MSSKKQITVVGATGNIGVPVVKNLVDFGYEVKVVVRNPLKAKRLFEGLTKVEIAKADLKDIPALKKALQDTAYLYLNLSTQTTNLKIPFAPEREGVANILAALDKDSIKQIICISGMGAFDNLIDGQAFKFIPNIIRKQGHKLIKESGIAYTILHCSWFADSFVFYQRNNIYSVVGDTQNPIYFTNCYNFSVHIANAVANPDALYREFPVQGNEGMKHPEAAKLFFSVFSENTKVKPLPSWLIAVLAVFKKEMKFLKHMADYFDDFKETPLAELCGTYDVLGQPTLSLTEYAKKLKTEASYAYLAN